MRRAQGAVEYGILIAAIVIVVVLGTFWFGSAIMLWFNGLAHTITSQS